jgi:hypothetical protein
MFSDRHDIASARHVYLVQCIYPYNIQSRVFLRYLSDERRSGGRVVFERRRNLLFRLVITSETMDPRLDKDKTELGVLVLPVGLEVLAHGNRLFDEVPKVLRDGWAKSYPQTKGI